MIKRESRKLFDCDYCEFKNECSIRRSHILPLNDYTLSNGTTRLTCEDFALILEQVLELKSRRKLALEAEKGDLL